MKCANFVKSFRTVSGFVVLLAVGMLVASCGKSPDLSTPSKAAAAFAKAVKEGDMDTLHKVALGSDKDFATLKSLSDMEAAMEKYQAASIKRFGDKGKFSEGMGPELMPSYENASEKIDGDKATVTDNSKNKGAEPIDLKKDGSQWKVSLDTMDKETEGMDKALPAMTSTFNSGAKDLDDGKYKTAEEAQTALGTQMMQVMAGGK